MRVVEERRLGARPGWNRGVTGFVLSLVVAASVVGAGGYGSSGDALAASGTADETDHHPVWRPFWWLTNPLPLYQNVTQEAGLGSFLHAGYVGPGNLEDPPPLFTEFTGPGACWLDHDDDGWLDLYLVNTRYQSDPAKNAIHDPHSKLFTNNGDGTFTDVTVPSNARTEGILQGCAAADYTNNGYPDLFVTGWNGSFLLRNDGGTFTDVTQTAGVEDTDCGEFACWASSATWFDADLDGCLDLYVSHFTEFDPEAASPGGGPGPGQINRFFQNQCDGTFADRTAQAGLDDVKSDTWSAVASDLNNDGWPDLYVSNDGDENDVYLNDGDGTFTRDPDNEANDPNSGMGTAVADFDRDGRHDLVTTNFIQQTNGIFQSFGNGYLNIGGNSPFDDAAPYSGWATNWFDMDNDGFLDLMVLNGITSDLGLVEPDQPVLSYRNLGATGSFDSVKGKLGPDLDGQWIARGGAWGDYDNDGAVDFLLAEAGESPTHLFHAYGVGNRFISVDVESDEPGVNRDAIGARVTVKAPWNGEQMQEKVAGSAYMSSSDPRLHFGVKFAKKADVTIEWPDGQTQTHEDVRTNTFVRAVQGEPLETVRVLPFITLSGPHDPVQRLEEAEFHADSEPATGRTIVGHEWHFGDGTIRDGGSTETHGFLDVGTFTVRVTVTDSEDDKRSEWKRVFVWDDLEANVTMNQDVFGLNEDPSGTVHVTFSDGDPVNEAEVDLLIQRTSGDPDLDEAIGNLPFFMHQLIGWVPMEISGVTDVNGTFSFTVPDNVLDPSPLLPKPMRHHPGTYQVTVSGGARGSVFDPAETAYNVVVPEL